jgi:glycosyltransferase involved in cell wall biosynthesis
MALSPYHITHIFLHQERMLPDLDTDQQGNYLVFWWKDIVLGHTFIEPGEKLLGQDYYMRCFTVIQPTVDFYRVKQHAHNDHWRELLLDQNFDAWLDFMERVFSNWTAMVIPAKVPVSVVICTRNRASYLLRCLTLLSNQTSQPKEIVVVDNAPTDESTYEVVRQFDGVIYLKELRPGLDIARNTGAFKASCPFVAFTDDDVHVHPLWVYRVWETFQDPSVAAMTGLVIASNLDTEAQLIFEKYWSFNRGYIDKNYDTRFFNQTLNIGPPVWEIGAGANMAFRKDVFKEVGFFDELLDVGAAGCNGDSEMWYRILEAGYTIHYNPRAVVHHEHRRDMEGLKKQIFYYMRGFTMAALLQQKRRREAGYKQHLFWTLPKYYLRMLYRGFPKYQFRFQTVGSELKGMLSGMIFYLRNKSTSAKVK